MEKAPSRRLVSGRHSRGYLPHIKVEGRPYFVTFRLDGTLPQEILRQYQDEREYLLQQADRAGRQLTWEEQQRLFQLYSEKIEAYLDAGHGSCWLRQPTVADLAAGALRYFEGKRYTLSAWVIMPNHVHVVVRPEATHTLSSILQSWKSYTASEANKLLNRVGQHFWQKESYDHWIRDDAEKARFVAYVENNPVAAGLCAQPEDWLWSSARERARS
ncbi:MAG: transposase [Verrucomicrobia bacterium]|nr:MAG: transposase [Verrucomicrobiota bacterium]